MLSLIPPHTTATSTVTSIGLPNNNKLTKKKFKSWGKKVVKKSSSIRKAVKKVLIKPFNIKKKLKAKKKRKAEERERELERQQESLKRDRTEGENPIPPTTICPEGGRISNTTLEEQAHQMAYSLNGNSNANNNISIKRGPSMTTTTKTSYSLHGHLSTQGPMKGVHSTTGVTGSTGSYLAQRQQQQQQSSVLPNKIHIPSGKIPKDYKPVDRSVRYRVKPQPDAGTSSRVSRTTEKHQSTGVTTTRRRSVSPSPVRTHGSVSSPTSTRAVRHHQARPASPSTSPRIGRTRSKSYSGAPLLEKRERPQPSRVRSPSVNPVRSPSIDPPRYAFTDICKTPMQSDESISKVIGSDGKRKSSRRHHHHHHDKVDSGEHGTKSSRHGQSSSSHHESSRKTYASESTTTHVSTPRQRRRQQREHDVSLKETHTSKNEVHVTASTKEPVAPKKEVVASKKDVDDSSPRRYMHVATSSSHSSYANLYGLRRSNSLILLRNGENSSVADCMAWHPSGGSSTSSRRNSYASSSQRITDTLSTDANTTKKSNVAPHGKMDNKKSPGESSAVVESSAKTSGGQSLTSGRNTTPTMSTDRKNTSGRDSSSKTSSVVPVTTPVSTTRTKDSTVQKTAAVTVDKKMVAPAKEERAATKSKVEKEGIEIVSSATQSNVRLGKLLGIDYKEQIATALTVSNGGVVGLRNLGNTCYMNSMIQCLSHTLELTHIFLTVDCRVLSGVARGFAKLLHNIWFSSSNSPSSNPLKWVLNKNTNVNHFPVISPQLLKSCVNKHLDFFCDYFQHDAQEFMRFFVSGLHEGFKKNSTFVPPPNTEGLSNTEHGNKMWSWITHIERSPIAKVFMGQLMSTLTCSVCHWTSVTFDPFWDIALPFPKTTGGSSALGKTKSFTELEKCLLQFCHEEVLDGDDMPICGNCKKHRQCTKKMILHRIPPVLVLVLKRFTRLNRAKVDTKVGIPNTLNLRHFSSAEAVKQNGGGRIPYELYATSNHMGSMSAGHYTAWVKHFSTDQWYTCNDSTITRHGPQDVTASARFYSTEAYVLFYRRVVR